MILKKLSIPLKVILGLVKLEKLAMTIKEKMFCSNLGIALLFINF
ncbi:hypothetical protein CLERM_144 [Coxiella-like endosymbiont]|nr:hypothetical protein CLERM_144 [Coxiella-like endosymbiont]